MLLLARWILPISSHPIENGAVVTGGDRIVSVGPAPKNYEGPVLDLKDSVLFPGLVNAHCHLEFSNPPEGGLSFTDWVRRATGASRDASPVNAKIDALLRGGTTTVADHVSPDTAPIDATPLRRIPFWEVLGADRERARRSLILAKDRAAREGGFVTPHSLYGVHQEVLDEILTPPSPPLSLHILESADENQFFRYQSGPLADYVVERGGEIPFPTTSPVKWLAVRHRLGPNLLLVHGNYLDLQEIEMLQGYRVGVIHCPGSHRFFGHRPFPLKELRKKEIRIALGTDSLLSNEGLSMLREMRLLRGSTGSDEILRMATIEGARMLQRDQEIGTLEVGKKADIVGVRMKNPSVDSFENILAADAVFFSMIDGQEIICTNP